MPEVKKKEVKVLPIVIMFVVLFIIMALGFALSGLSTWLCWHWFIVPLGVPEIGFFHALGFCIMMEILVQRRDSSAGGNYWKRYVSLFLLHLFLLGMACGCWLLM